MPTVTQIVTQIAPISEILASNDIANGALYGAPLNPMWAIQIYLETKTCRWRYDYEEIATGGTPSATMIANSNYLYSIICGKYGQRALYLINSGGVVPGTGTSTTTYGLPTTSSYEAVTEGQTVMELKDVNGNPLPIDARVTFAQKGIYVLTSNQYSFSYPELTLLGGLQMSEFEKLTFQYAVPI
jgi:hypothetical protein